MRHFFRTAIILSFSIFTRFHIVILFYKHNNMEIIKKTNVISEPKNLYTGDNPIFHMMQIANASIPETLDTTVLGILISSHGIIDTKTINKKYTRCRYYKT